MRGVNRSLNLMEAASTTAPKQHRKVVYGVWQNGEELYAARKSEQTGSLAIGEGSHTNRARDPISVIEEMNCNTTALASTPAAHNI